MSTIKYKNPTTGDWSEAVVDVRMEEPTLVPLSVNQNGVYTPSLGTDGYSSVTVDVPNPSTGTLTITQNGVYDVSTYAQADVQAGPAVDDKVFKFIDEDWNVIAEYTYQQAQALTSLPSLPAANTYLTAVDWQLTVAEVNDMASDPYYQTRMNYIAPVYHPTMGPYATHIFVTFNNAKELSDAYIMLSKTASNVATPATIDWGDGSSVETYNFYAGGPLYEIKQHVYSPTSYPVSYVITIDNSSDTSRSLTFGGYTKSTYATNRGSFFGSCPFTSASPWTDSNYALRGKFTKYIKKIIVGCKWGDNPYAFYKIASGSKIIICGDKDSTSQYYNVSSTGTNFIDGLTYSGVKEQIKPYYIINNSTQLINNRYSENKIAQFGSSALDYNDYINYIYYKTQTSIPNYSTELYYFPRSVNNSSFYDITNNNKIVYCSNSITSIYCILSASTTFYFTALDHVPTLGSNNAEYRFSNKIIVPDSLYTQWINATNWSAISDIIVKESEA